MNGSIESFNNWFKEKFWEKEAFTSLEDMRAKSKHFVAQYNDLSVWKRRNKVLMPINPIKTLKNVTGINLDKLPLSDGKIHSIRKVDNGGKISVLNESFEVGGEFIGEYVWATICLAKRKMEVYYRAKDQDDAVLIKDFEYAPIEEVIPLRQDILKS